MRDPAAPSRFPRPPLAGLELAVLAGWLPVAGLAVGRAAPSTSPGSLDTAEQPFREVSLGMVAADLDPLPQGVDPTLRKGRGRSSP